MRRIVAWRLSRLQGRVLDFFERRGWRLPRIRRRLRLFALDLHISVIADVRDLFRRNRGGAVAVTEWSLSGHTWVMAKPHRRPLHLNAATWQNLDWPMIGAFRDHYARHFGSFDGFVVTFSPVFCLLYERTAKPVLLINCCRYEQPFCYQSRLDRWAELNGRLALMAKSGQLLCVSNNQADRDYLRIGTGIESELLPSLCLYTGANAVEPTRRDFLLFENNPYWRRHEGELRRVGAVFSEDALQPGHRWRDRFAFRAVVHLPYEISTMSTFEFFSAGVPQFFPSRKLLHALWTAGEISFNGPYAKTGPTEELTAVLSGPAHRDFWLDRADYYNPDIMPFVHYYESAEHLVQLLAAFEDAQRGERLAWIEGRNRRVLRRFDEITRQHFGGNPAC